MKQEMRFRKYRRLFIWRRGCMSWPTTLWNPLREFRLVNRDWTERLARAAVLQGIRRFVYLSPIKVNGESTNGIPFRADDLPAPADPYAVSKHEAEQGLLRMSSLDPVIIRPPLVYGPGVKGYLARFCRLADLGPKPIVGTPA